jgi:hypothetical protein
MDTSSDRIGVMAERLQLSVGTWRVRRRIVDLLHSSTTTFEGQASITAMQFTEQGQIRSDVGSDIV